MIKEIRYSQMTLKAMFELYNEHAEAIDEPRLKKRPADRVEMCRLLALLMTIRKKPVGRVRDVVIEELCKVCHYENEGNTHERSDAPRRGFLPVGFPYVVVLERIKARLPKSKISMDALLVHATNIRKKKRGYRGANMPPKRLRTKKESK